MALSVILINGEPQERLSVLDRGFQYGDGLFETLRVTAGRPQQWERHYQRLRRGCERLALPLPQRDLLERELELACHDVASGTLKIILTRGRGPRGYAPPDEVRVTRVVAVSEPPSYPPARQRDGIVLTVCRTPLGLNPALAGIKHLNRLEQVLARAEWNDPAIDEGIMLDTQGRVIAGTMSNLFCVRDGCLTTPDLSQCGVEGVTRARVLDAAAAAGQPAEVRQLWLEDVRRADEVFVCNSLMGIWPVRRLDDRTWQPGPITRALSEALGK